MKTSLLLICLSFFFIFPLSAQTIEYDGENQSQTGMIGYPSPKHFYLTGGAMHIGTDISAPEFGGWSAGIGYQYYLSDLQNPFFLRLGLMYGTNQDVDDKLVSEEAFGLNEVFQRLGYTGFIRNYFTTMVGMQGSIGYDFVNILTEGGAQRLGIYALAGPDVFYYTTKYDALDANNLRYDFSSIDLEADNAEEQVRELLDGSYETEAPETGKLGVGFNIGLGLRYHFSEGFGLGVEHQLGFSFSDNIDGYDTQDENDSIHHTRAFIYISLWEPSPGT